jgi:hypothetical protein
MPVHFLSCVIKGIADQREVRSRTGRKFHLFEIGNLKSVYCSATTRSSPTAILVPGGNGGAIYLESRRQHPNVKGILTGTIP